MSSTASSTVSLEENGQHVSIESKKQFATFDWSANTVLGLISFSEATRYTPQKYKETEAWCRDNDRRLPKHLLYPRTKGFITTVQHLRKAPHVKAVYDFTIAYQHRNRFHEAPDMWETLKLPNISSGHGYKFHVHARRFALEELPHTDEELAKWLEQRWIEKGEWLEEKKRAWSAN